jgi:aspartyl-tRNA(Asn)/glutamyl-tRNA(Gln) amidotransferase subunit A
VSVVPFGDLEREGRQLIEKSIEAAESSGRRLNAFINFDGDAVRRAALDAMEGPLAGIPIAVKDNIVTGDGVTTCGSKMLRDFRSPCDATAVGRLKAAGAVVCGKTNLDEFAMGSSTEHSAFGVCRNPWDLDRVAGGSSGGSAAAVAARIVPAALGSDTGGSVRQPAAFCGVIGLKPTWGRVSRSGLVAFASSLDQIGVITTSVPDCALLLGTIAGHDAADSTSSSLPGPDYIETLERGVAGERFAVIEEAVTQLSPELRANLEAAADVLRLRGAVVESISIPSIGYAIAVYYIVANAEASANLARFDGIRYGERAEGALELRQLYAASRGAGFGEEVKRRIMLGTFALSSGYHDAYYGRAQNVREWMKREFAAAFERFDFLVSPTTPAPAFRIGEKAEDPLSMYLSDIFTVPANLVGFPAIALPSGFTAEGLPVSLQVMAPHFGEADLLRAARAYERETNYGMRRPPVVPD